MMLIVSRLYMQYENPTKLHAVTSDNLSYYILLYTNWFFISNIQYYTSNYIKTVLSNVWSGRCWKSIIDHFTDCLWKVQQSVDLVLNILKRFQTLQHYRKFPGLPTNLGETLWRVFGALQHKPLRLRFDYIKFRFQMKYLVTKIKWVHIFFYDHVHSSSKPYTVPIPHIAFFMDSQKI